MATNLTIGFVGMTHLGLCSAVAAASKGFATIGFDRDGTLVESLNYGKLPIVEPGLDDLLHEHRERITFSSDAGVLAACNLIYVAPDVPTDDAGRSDLAALDSLVDF